MDGRDALYNRGDRFKLHSNVQGTLFPVDAEKTRRLLPSLLSPELLFPEAFARWLARRTMTRPGVATRVKFLSQRSLKDYKACAKALEKYFGQMRLMGIGPEQIADYQQARAYCDVEACQAGLGEWTKPCGANRIRKEVDLLIRLLKAAKLWSEEAREETLLVQREDKDVPRAMDPEEQARFLETAAGREDWRFVYHYAILGLHTSAATNELRSLQLGDLMLSQPGYEMITIRAEGAKNKFRVRSIPLSGQAVWAMRQLLARAAELGSCQAHHYLFPFREARERWNPLRPMSDSGLKKRWDAVRKKAGVPWLRPYDLRHTGITRMAEAGVPVEVAMSLVGHMTRQMHEHYTSISKGAKRRWMQVTWEGQAGGEYQAPKKPPGRETGNANQSGNGFPQKSVSSEK